MARNVQNSQPVEWILLACDHDRRRTVFRSILEKAGFGVEFAEEHMVVEKTKHSHYDLILFDVDGKETTRGLNAVASIRSLEDQRGIVRTPILAVIRGGDEGLRSECTSAGVDAVLEAPVTTVRLVKQVTDSVTLSQPFIV